MTKVSVIIPTYQRALVLGEALKSLTEQTYSDFEAIIVDDHSLDSGATLKVVNCFKDSRFKYCYLGCNKGPSGARNAALPFCKGEYISFLDSDDLFRPRKLEVQVSILDSDPDVAMVYSDEYLLYHDGSFSQHPIREGKKQLMPSGYIAREFFQDSFIGTMTVTLRKSVIQELGGFDEKLIWNEDDDLWFRIMIRHKVKFSDYPAGIRRLHDNDNHNHNLGNMSKNRHKMVYYQFLTILKYFETEKDFMVQNTDIVRERTKKIMKEYINDYCLRRLYIPYFKNIYSYLKILNKR